jgi:hypothetical protein
MEKFKQAVEELRSKTQKKEQAIRAKVSELEAKEEELNGQINASWQKVVEAELSNDDVKATSLKKDIAKAKAELTGLQEQKNAYKKASATDGSYSVELAEIKKLAIEAREYRIKDLAKVRETIAEHIKKQQEMEKTLRELRATEGQLFNNESEGCILRPIAGIINSELLNTDIPRDTNRACQIWLDRSEEDFKEMIREGR